MKPGRSQSVVRRIKLLFARRQTGLPALLVRTFGLALIAELARFRFFPTRLIICLGPMAAVRAEMPGVSIGFASIGSCHGVCVLFLWKGSGLFKSHR